MKVIVLSREDYEFNDQNTGEIVRGATVYYLIGNGQSSIQLKINSFNNNLKLLDDIKSVPAVYKIDFANVVRKQKIVQVEDKFTFIKEIDLFKDI